MYLRMNKRSLELYASSVSDVALWDRGSYL